jgi:glycosyltransferase involved in cell wall biosynthesis
MCDLIQEHHLAIVCDTLPYPTRSGDNQRIAELIRVLREQGWFVHLVLTALLDGKTRALCRSHVDALHTYTGTGLRTRSRNGLRRTIRFFDRLGKKLGLPPAEEIATRLLGRSVAPIILDYWQRYPKGLDEVVANFAFRHRWKAVIVEYLWLYPAAAKLQNGIARLLDTHDIQHRRVEEFASRGMAFPLSISRKNEVEIFRQFDAVIAIQAAEAALIRSLCPDLRVLTAGSMGSGTETIPERPIEGRILYVGGYNGANIDGLKRFLAFVWPKIRERHMHCHLHVCGYIYRAFLGVKFENVEFLGHIENLEREYAKAMLVVNPCWIGTGLKIKSVEALARGKPLVTTAKGVEGLHQDVQKACLVTNDEEEFANHALHLLTAVAARIHLSEAARNFARRHLNPEVVYKELIDFLDEHK